MTENRISIASDFSKYPAGRYYSDGKYSGEYFRNDILVPSLKKYNKTIVYLDNESGYGSSFIDEAFGGLVRNANLDKTWLQTHLVIEATQENETYIEEIWDDINNA